MTRLPTFPATSRTLLISMCSGLLFVVQAANAEQTAPAQGSAQSSPPSLKQQVEQAYEHTDSYHAKINYRMVVQDGRWKRSRQASLEIAFDRSEQKLLIDRPSVLVNTNGQFIRLKIKQIEDKFLKQKQTAKPLSLAMLTQTLPALGRPALPDMLMLISDTPWVDMVSQGGSAGGSAGGGTGPSNSGPRVEQVPSDDSSLAMLKVTGAAGVMRLGIDPQTHLIRKAKFKVDSQHAGLARGDSVREVFKIDVRQRNESLGDEVFAFNPGDREAVDSLSALAGGRGGPNAGRPGSRRIHPLTGKQAPPVSLAQADGGRFNLKDVQADVIVLDFWATWCGPCRFSLPRLQAVADWADQNHKSVAIYTVNQGESRKQAKSYWKQAGLSMPILLDKNMQVSRAYKARAIPQTVIIRHGKVEKVHVGVKPKGTLKNDLEKMLDQP